MAPSVQWIGHGYSLIFNQIKRWQLLFQEHPAEADSRAAPDKTRQPAACGARF